MTKKIQIYNREVNYSVKRSKRAKRMRLAVYCDGNFIVTIPKKFPTESIDKYIVAKSKWVISKLDFYDELNKKQKITFSNKGFEVYKDQALKIISGRVKALNDKYYQYGFNNINIKKQKTRWGSCSRKKNLNFNYKILFLPPKLRDYIIIHELCHLKEFNHSRKFWNLVKKSIPRYDEIRNELKSNGLLIS